MKLVILEANFFCEGMCFCHELDKSKDNDVAYGFEQSYHSWLLTCHGDSQSSDDTGTVW